MDPHEQNPLLMLRNNTRKLMSLFLMVVALIIELNFAKQNKTAKTINLAHLYNYKDGTSGGNEHFGIKLISRPV